MEDYWQRLNVLHQSPRFPEIMEKCRKFGFNSDSSSHFWVIDEHIFYYDGINWFLMTLGNYWKEESSFAEELIYNSDIECAFPIPIEIVDRLGIKFVSPVRQE